MSKLIELGMVVFTSAALLAPPASFAQSPELQTKLENVSASVDKLSEVKEEAAVDPAAEKKEVDARKKALLDIVNLSIAEIKTLQEKLQVIPRNNAKELVQAKDQFEEDLKIFLRFTQTQKIELEFEASTKASLQRRAGEFKAWREDSYDPEVKDIFDLLILLQGKALISTAQTRLEKIAADVDKLEAVYGAKAEGLQIFIDQATKHVTSAALFEQRAHLLFVKNFSDEYFRISLQNPDLFFASVLELFKPKPVELEIAVEDNSIPAVGTKEKAPVKEETVQSFIRSSLEEITKAYKVFLELIDVAKLKKLIK